MKNLLFILLIFSGYVQAQDQTIGRRNNRVVVLGRMGIDSVDYSNSAADTFLSRGADGIIKKSTFSDAISAYDGTTKKISGSVIWDSNFVFHNTTIVYQILGRRFTAAASTFTVTSSHPTLDRFTVVYADTLGNIGTIDGANGSPADIPNVDPASQILLAVYEIKAGSTSPYQLGNNSVYRENVEWTPGSNITSADFAYPTNPFSGDVSAYFPGFTNGQYFNFTDLATYDLANYSYIKFYIRLSASFTGKYISVKFNESGVKRTNYIAITDGAFGFNANLLNTWQLVAIPMSEFSYTDVNFNEVYFVMSGAGGAFQIDNIQLQTGGVTISSGVNSFNGMTGNVIGEFADSANINSDTSLYQFYNKYTGKIVFTVPTLLQTTFLGYLMKLYTVGGLELAGVDSLKLDSLLNARAGAGTDSFAYRRDLTSIDSNGNLLLGALNGKDTFIIVGGSGTSRSGVDSMYVTPDSLYQVFVYSTGRKDSVIYIGSGGAGGSGLTYPYTTKKYLNGYGNFPSFITDSITEGSINLFSKWGRTGSDIYYNTGKVFVGKTSGTFPLDVNGFISSTGGGISLNGDTTMAVSPTGYYAFGAYPHSTSLYGISIGKDAQSFFGYGVGTAGSFSVAIGNNTLRYLDNNRPYGNPAAGNFNTAIGDNIASNCQGCAFNTLIGSGVAQNLTGYPASNQGQSNIAIGAGSLPDITTGVGNIVLGSIYDYSLFGSGAGSGITTGGDNIMIGNGLSGFTSSLYNNILIGGSSTNPTFGANSNGVTSNAYGGAIASASIITPIGNLFHITGTTTITSISTTTIYPGTRITIIFDGALTLTDGSNLKLNGNFATTADDTITLVCDGTNWYEVSRSTN